MRVPVKRIAFGTVARPLLRCLISSRTLRMVCFLQHIGSPSSSSIISRTEKSYELKCSDGEAGGPASARIITSAPQYEFADKRVSWPCRKWFCANTMLEPDPSVANCPKPWWDCCGRSAFAFELDREDIRRCPGGAPLVSRETGNIVVSC
jgi:hypothetical protein